MVHDDERSAAGSDELPIRSFRLAFDFERRLFKLDRWRLPFAYGVALRTIGYAAAALAAVLVLSALPLAGAAVAAIPAPLRLVVIPLASAYGLTRVDVDGRPAHTAALAWLRHAAAPARVIGLRHPERARRVVVAPITVAPDEHTPRYRRAVVHGPATLVLRYPVRARARGATLRLERIPGEPLRRSRRVTLSAGRRAFFR